MSNSKNKTNTPREKNPSPKFAPSVKYRVRVAKRSERRADCVGYVDNWRSGSGTRDGQPGSPASLRLSEVGGKLMTRLEANRVAVEIFCSKSEYGDYIASVVGPSRH